eukprot:CAMPEP_0202972012 /NCGR_PEP_ID=MMETSP1396-20130829/32578_1 /ASSEMBLY_ACC=CAM_ASM_000872 /TAXON_ID= /ORGANISM="Pseudokeronopsis sp., Strain Brazil" /LENGTH=475 /DNA_ID=CAMNT_0049701985 /DNA_START=88 /DNA_END=1512 /DNA_ORIENTATION=+
MEVGYDVQGYSIKVSSVDCLLADPDIDTHFNSALSSAKVELKDCGSTDYDSDGCSHSEVDRSCTTAGSPFSPHPSRLIGVEEDLTREVGHEVSDLTDFGSIPKYIHHRIETGLEVGSFLVTNLATVIAQYNLWKQELPMVQPFYAVKCNPDPAIVRLLSFLGASFDCATQGEIDMVVNGLGDELSFGAKGCAATSIVYANPAKMSSMLEFAVKNGVRMTVFDGEDELYKISSIPGGADMELLLRLTTDDKSSVCRFSKKFGCPVAEAPNLLRVAKELGLNVAGVSFHVGSGCGDPAAYSTAIEHARIVFEEGYRLGFTGMHIVDIGGGFPGDSMNLLGNLPTFPEIAAAIRDAIETFKNSFENLPDNMRFIAEPGRFFVSASTTIATKVYSRKGGHNNYQALYVDDGVYGSFNNVIYDHAVPVPLRLTSVLDGENVEGKGIPTAVFGPTCDGIDQMCALESTVLPRCEVGDWLIW